MVQVATRERQTAGALSGLTGLPWRTAPLGALSLRFEVRCNELELAERLGSLLSSLGVGGAADHRYELVVCDDGRVEVSLDGRMLVHADSRPHAVAWLLWHISRAAVEVTSDHLLIHAAAVESAAGAVLLPAPPNGGKTTLTAALVRAGLRYLTDEVVAISPATNCVLPFPRPMTLEPGSLRALVDLDPAAPSWWAGSDCEGTACGDGNARRWWHVPAENIDPRAVGRPCPPSVVVFPRYQPGAPTRLEPIGTADAVLELATNAFNLDQHGGRGLRNLAGLAGQCSCYRLDVSSLADACGLVLAVAPGP